MFEAIINDVLNVALLSIHDEACRFAEKINDDYFRMSDLMRLYSLSSRLMLMKYCG